VQRWVLEGTDYVYPRTTNKILEAYLKLKGVKDEDIMINYTPFGFADWQTEVSQDQAFGSAGKKTAVVSTINGDANVPFYKELGNQGLKATDIRRGGVLGRRGRARRSRHQAVGRPPRRVELFRIDQDAGERRLHQGVARLHQESEAHHQRSDGGAFTSASTCG